VAAEQLAGVKVRARAAGLRGVRVSRADEDVSIRVRGPDLEVLAAIGDRLVERLRGRPACATCSIRPRKPPGVRGAHRPHARRRAGRRCRRSRPRAAHRARRHLVIGDFIEGDRAYDVRVRLPQARIDSPAALEALPLFGAQGERPAVIPGRRRAHRAGGGADRDPAREPAPHRRGQRRADRRAPLGEVVRDLREGLRDFELPPGYSLYYGGAFDSLRAATCWSARWPGWRCSWCSW
jgi:Cu/Ag efflux pump CusA